MTYVWNIFWKTFAQLAAAFLLTVQGYDWAVDNFRANIETTAVGLIVAGIGALVAAGWAFVGTPAVSAVGKATRSAIQWLLGGLGAVVINDLADITSLPSVLFPTIVGAVLAFAITFAQNQPAPATQ